MNTQIIAIANQKGGVGKTTTCANLGIGLAQAGRKVLLIDGDPQGSLTISLGNPQPDKLPFTLSDAMGRILMDEPLRPSEGILHHPEGVDLMPADIQLSGMEVSLVNAMSRETILRQYLDTVKGQYSHILIDCQPSLGMLTVNALAAANRVIIPVQAEYLPAKGLEQLLSTVSKVKRQINPKLQIDGRLVREGYRSHKLKPYRKAAQAERQLEKANINVLYQKSLQENPQFASNPFSRWQQKQAIKKQYAAAKHAGQAAGNTASAAQKTGKAAKTVKEKAQQAGAFIMRHKKGFLLVGAIFLLICLLLNTMSSCSMMAQSIGSAISGSTYPSDDPELVAVEADYAARETALQAEIDNIESSHPGYDEYRYDLDMIGHDPHELAAFLSAVLQGYTQSSAQGELERVFSAQYTLTLTEEIQIRTYTDEDGDTHEYEYRILHVKLESRPISSLATELLTPEQLEMYQVYRQTLGNKPLIFGGGSTNTSDSEGLDGVEFVNGTRPGNPELVELAKRQVGNVGGQPYWSWYGFNSRVEWCACFVSWCYGQMGLSEPRFAACQSQGIPWFQSHGQWGARGYDNLAPGDAIFFDWDLDGSADHVGIVIGTDGSRVYTVEGNSGDACKIRSYDVNYECIKGYAP